MLKNFFSVAIRHLLIHKYYAAINVLGLAVALAAFLLINLYVISEFSYDRHHPDSERIYRIDRDFIRDDEPLLIPGNAEAVGPLLKNAFPEIEDYTRVYPYRFVAGRPGEALFHEDEIRPVDSNHFDFFSYDWLQGDPATALAEPFSIVLTQGLARKYFGDANSLGETLMLEQRFPVTVTGLIADIPDNTHLAATAFVSMSSMPAIEGEPLFDRWSTNNFHTYLRLRPGSAYEALGEDFARYLHDSMPEQHRELWDFRVLNVADIHLHSPTSREELSPLGNISRLRALILVGLGLLTIACVNFINITTARSARRGKEVALRKTVGSGSALIMQQFIGESLLQIVLAIGIALPMVELLLPLLKNYLGMNVELSLLSGPGGMLLLLGSGLFLGVVAGVYPAFHLARLNPVRIFSGQQAHNRTGLSLRNLLVVFQFTVAIVLLIATTVIALQVKLGREIELGFSKDRILVLEGMMLDGFGPQWSALKNELLAHAGIGSMSRSNVRPFQSGAWAFPQLIRYEGGSEEGLNITVMLVDIDFFETYEVGVPAGRTFSEDAGRDEITLPSAAQLQTTGAFMLNAAAAESLGWTPQEAVEHWIELDYSEFSGDFSALVHGQIIGVVDDMKMFSAREQVVPMFYYVPPENFANGARHYASLKLTGADLPGTLAFIDATWRRFFPEQPIRRTFLDTSFDALYKPDSQFGMFIGIFSLLTVCIACLGLQGLAAFAAEQRTKEIGVRKVMGGSVWSIVLLLTNNFSRLVLLANVIAWPVAYMGMTRWLENFAYRIDLTPLIFIGSGLIALCIAWVTVGGTAAKAASAKPVLALRYE